MAEEDNSYDSGYESEDNGRNTKAEEIITLLRQDLVGIRGFITEEFIKLAQHNQGIIDINNPEFQQARLSLLESDPNAPENHGKAVLSLKATLQGINKKLEQAQSKQNIDPKYFKKFREEMNSTTQEIHNQLSTETALKSLINRRLVGKLFNKVMIMDLDKGNNPVSVHPSKKQALLDKILPSIRDLPPNIEKKMLLGSVPQGLEEKINQEVLKHFTKIDKSHEWGVLDQGRLTNENIKNFSKVINQAVSTIQYTPSKDATEVDVIQGKVVSILEQDKKTGKKYLVDDPKIVIGKRKGILAALGIVNKRKYVGIIDQHGNYIQDKAKVQEVVDKIKNREFVDIDGNTLGKFNNDASLPRNFKITLDDNLIVHKDGQLAGIKRGNDLQDQYGSSLYQDKIINNGAKSYIIEDTGRDINTQQGLANLAKTPSRGALKGSRESAKKEAQQIGTDLARKQASPKERAREDRKVALDIARKARATKRSQSR